MEAVRYELICYERSLLWRRSIIWAWNNMLSGLRTNTNTNCMLVGMTSQGDLNPGCER